MNEFCTIYLKQIELNYFIDVIQLNIILPGILLGILHLLTNEC